MIKQTPREDSYAYFLSRHPDFRKQFHTLYYRLSAEIRMNNFDYDPIQRISILKRALDLWLESDDFDRLAGI